MVGTSERQHLPFLEALAHYLLVPQRMTKREVERGRERERERREKERREKERKKNQKKARAAGLLYTQAVPP